MDIQGVWNILYSPLRVGQFASVGAIGAIFDNIVLITLATAGITPELAKLIGIEVAIVVMFILNEHWTFAKLGAPGLVAFLRRLLTSNLVRIGGILVQLVVFSLVYRWLHIPLYLWEIDLWLLVASGTGIVAGMVINYISESIFTWRVHRISK